MYAVAVITSPSLRTSALSGSVGDADKPDTEFIAWAVTIGLTFNVIAGGKQAKAVAGAFIVFDAESRFSAQAIRTAFKVAAALGIDHANVSAYTGFNAATSLSVAVAIGRTALALNAEAGRVAKTGANTRPVDAFIAARTLHTASSHMTVKRPAAEIRLFAATVDAIHPTGTVRWLETRLIAVACFAHPSIETPVVVQTGRRLHALAGLP